MEIIPAIDLMDGKCVRLRKGDFDQRIVYSDDPLEMAKIFEDEGIVRLHLVDLDGAKAGALRNLEVLEDIANCTDLTIDYGGGIKSVDDARRVFETGADLVTIGSVAVTAPAILKEITALCGPESILIGADVLNEQIHIHGWKVNTGIHIHDFLTGIRALGITRVFCTDIAKDGMLEGVSPALYQQIVSQHQGLSLIASGGVTTLHDLEVLRDAGCTGAIIGKALYEGTITFAELKSLHFI